MDRNDAGRMPACTKFEYHALKATDNGTFAGDLRLLEAWEIIGDAPCTCSASNRSAAQILGWHRKRFRSGNVSKSNPVERLCPVKFWSAICFETAVTVPRQLATDPVSGKL